MGEGTDRKIELKGAAILILAAAVYGSGLVAQKAGMDSLGPFAFSALRFLLGAAALVPLMLIIEKRSTPEQKAERLSGKPLVIGCFICAVDLVFMVASQQIGLPYTTVGKAGFITSLYVILTPIAGVLFLKRKISHRVWVAAVMAVIGFYLLSLTGGMTSLNFGDGLMLIAAVSCTIYVYLMEYFSVKAEPVKFTMLQFLFTGGICAIFAIIFETTTMQDVINELAPILYAGLGICAIGYTLQMIGQKYVESSRATILLSSESLFSLFSGMIYYHELLSVREYIGCALIFSAIILTEIKINNKKDTENEQH